MVYIILMCIQLAIAQFTHVKTFNPVLSRQKRYLTFPKGSNMVITLSLLKAVLQVQPKGINIALECDVPFDLPSDTRLFYRRPGYHRIQKRQIYSRFLNGFESFGFGGQICMERFLCESIDFVKVNANTFMAEILSVFLWYFDDITLNCEKYLGECPISLLQILN